MSAVNAPAPLFPGLRLDRDEFLRRWDLLPDLKRAELIDGIVYMASPVGIRHGQKDTTWITLLGTYAALTPGCQAANNITWLMLESAPQADSCLCVLPEYGGQSRIEGHYASGAPELAVEVTGSTQTQDLKAKAALYQRAGVLEYITYELEPHRIAWRTLIAGSYVAVPPDRDGIYRSQVFPGLWVDADALAANQGARLLEVLQQGLASPEHSAFVTQLAEAHSRYVAE